MAGFDTANFVQNEWPSVAHFGTPLFWLRYFTPCQNTPVNVSSANANAECTAVWQSNSSSPMLGPITTPDQTRLNGTSAEGLADAQALASALYATWIDVTPLQLPNNNILYCWLDQEPSTTLNTGYWDAWALYLDGYNWSDFDIYPLYPCLYCAPNHNSTNPNCSTIASASAYYCYAVWSAQPQECSNTLTNPPAWDADTCASSGATTPTSLWQFADGTGICFPDDVDLDLGAPGFYTPDYCFFLSAEP